MQHRKHKAKTDQAPHWTERWRNAVPTRDTLAAHPWLKPIAHHVLDPKLWRMHHESVARGAGIGIFWAFVLPAGQILAAVANSVWWRANIPVAAGLTLITNRAGSLVLDAPPPLPLMQITQNGGMADYLSSLGAPAILGMGMFAVGGSLAAYVFVKAIWRVQFWLRQKPRLNRKEKFNRSQLKKA